MNIQTNFMDDEIRAEIEQVRLENEGKREYRYFLARWFNGLPVASKLKLTAGLPVIGLALVSLAALIGFSKPNWVPGLFAFISILVPLVLFLSFLCMRRMLKDTTGPIEDIAKEMSRLASGERDIEINGLDRDDEIGELAGALQVFVKSGFKLDELFATRKQATEKQKRLLMELADNFEKQIGDVVSGVASASTQLHSTASSMASAAEQVSSQTELVSKSMEEASSGVTAAAAASDEFAMSIGEISRQAASSAELARDASSAASNADTTISALADSADQVGQIVELIQTIAQRTNLLALNASIEAARGGEAGRGFAVVASEVKELASQTSKATEEVAEQIRAMQDSTGASVSALRSIGEQIKQLETTAISIASAVDQQSVAGQDLARSIDVAARSTDEVSANIAEVRETSVSTGSAASQVLSSANDLEGQATRLRGQVQDFLSHIRSG